MAFWDRVSAELIKAAAEGWEAVKAGTKVAAEKSEEVAKTGKLRYKSHTVHKKADKLFGQLGGIVYDMAEPPFENPLLRADVQRLLEDIKQVEQEATSIDEEVERVKKSASSDASDVPYYYETKSDAKNEGNADESSDDEDGGDQGDGEDVSEHACYSDCSGPCQCTDHTVVNSDLPEDDGVVESHDYKCPTDDDPAGEQGEQSDGDVCQSDDVLESCEDKAEESSCEATEKTAESGDEDLTGEEIGQESSEGDAGDEAAKDSDEAKDSDNDKEGSEETKK